jgi:hypothetical protein
VPTLSGWSTGLLIGILLVAGILWMRLGAAR